MSRSYKFICRECGYKDEYYCRGSFLDNQYYEEVEQKEKELGYEIETGKYGKAIRNIYKTEKCYLYCHQKLFQCRNCYHVGVSFSKEILWKNDLLDGIVEIRSACPKCNEKSYAISQGTQIVCPMCHKAQFMEISIALGD